MQCLTERRGRIEPDRLASRTNVELRLGLIGFRPEQGGSGDQADDRDEEQEGPSLVAEEYATDLAQIQGLVCSSHVQV